MKHLQLVGDVDVTMEKLLDLHFESNLILSNQFAKHEKIDFEKDWQPLIFHRKSYERFPKIELEEIPMPNLNITDVLSRRKSCRRFRPYKIKKEELSSIFYSAIREEIVGNVPHRSYPSAGALYSINLYTVIIDSEDISKGVYYYSPNEHRLELIYNQIDFAEKISEAMNDDMINTPSAYFIITSSLFKSCMKYKARGYRYSLIEAGGLSQTINLCANALGFDAVWIGGFSDEIIVDLLDLNIDTELEVPIMLMALGKS